MPVIKTIVGQPDVAKYKSHWEELAEELKNAKDFGQPMIFEEEFPRTGLVGVTVVWDRLANCPDAVRPAIITKAYEEAGLGETARKMAFAVGFTMPEATEAGMLSWEITPLLKGDEIASLQTPCFEAMKAVGASSLTRSQMPLLRLDSLDQATKYKDELIRMVAGSEKIWSISTTDMEAYRAAVTVS